MQGDQSVSVASLHVYPIKSCGGISLTEALLIETGIEFDRAWMVVDPAGMFVTQRELPRMALIQPTLKTSEMVLRAPGMLALHVALDRVETPVRATVWGDEVAAYDMGDLCAQWFSDFLGRPLRLVRFDPEQKRLSDPKWTGTLDAENAFADGFPILVSSVAAIDELNRRLQSQGLPDVTMARFRPNLVLDGLDAHGEDALDEIEFATDDGPVRIRLVKPCARCPIPDVDPLTAEPGHAVGDTLAGYRADARLDGKITFGMNAVIVEGIERVLRVGMTGAATFKFD
ncbi:MAG: MOSC N-terminal beta barrel domain-containing protein [Burkholderiales bacterium]